MIFTQLGSNIPNTKQNKIWDYLDGGNPEKSNIKATINRKSNNIQSKKIKIQSDHTKMDFKNFLFIKIWILTIKNSLTSSPNPNLFNAFSS